MRVAGHLLLTAGLLVGVAAASPAGTASADVEPVHSQHASPPPVPAFPGAVGYGKTSVGGRGGTVIYVRNLADSGPGSLRAALTARGPRVVVFRVSGTIALDSTIVVRHPYLTIAGQTAPGGGVALRHSGAAGFGSALVELTTHDIVIRHLRFRRGPSAEGECCGDDLSMVGASRVIIDHSSFSWSTDELLDTWPARRVTVQWSIFSEALGRASHEEGGRIQSHALGPLFGAASDKITVYRNLFIDQTGRNPLISPTGGGDFQLLNNVVHNVCYAMGFEPSSTTARLNAIGNTITQGPGTCGRGRASILLGGTASVYVRDNLTPYRRAGQPEWLATAEFLHQPPAPTSYRSATRHPMIAVPTTSATRAFTTVLARAGATLPTRDVVDRRAVRHARSGSGRLIDDPADVGGWPELATGTPYPDADHDGMDDEWETAHALDPASRRDGALDRDGDGYTNLEEFLNRTRP